MRALVIVDVQNDFCPGGSLATPSGATVAAGIAEYINEHHNKYATIVATKDWHIDPGEHFSDNPDFESTWPVHCVADTDGAEFHPGLLPALDHIDDTFFKGQHAPAYSGFEGYNASGESLTQWLRNHDITIIDVVGIATDYCVKATVLDALANDFEVKVLTDYVAAVDEQTGQDALGEMVKSGSQVA